MSRWVLDLIGDSTDLERAYGAFSSFDPSVTKEGGAFLLSSTEWAAIQEAETVRNRGKHLAKIISDALHLHYRDSRPLLPGPVTRTNDDGTRQTYNFAEANIQLRGDRLVASGTTGAPSRPAPQHPAVAIFRIAAHRPDLQDALRHFSTGDWSALYKAFEIVRDDIGQEEITRRKWTTRRALTRFTQTAQSSQALGDQARHASKKFAPPATPMSFHEAKALVGELLQKWVDFALQQP